MRKTDQNCETGEQLTNHTLFDRRNILRLKTPAFVIFLENGLHGTEKFRFLSIADKTQTWLSLVTNCFGTN